SEQSLAFSDPFLNRQRANDFMQPGMRLQAISQERIRERTKTPWERQREICENYPGCDPRANYGYASAYRQYFGRRRTK
ncbi:MGP protein, partial [Dromaius novaehollandiae]|nr:MGP protein [Casuarius casuarius]NXG29142.1 MGP protein [Dromaius novaehollandiae]